MRLPSGPAFCEALSVRRSCPEQCSGSGCNATSSPAPTPHVPDTGLRRPPKSRGETLRTIGKGDRCHYSFRGCMDGWMDLSSLYIYLSIYTSIHLSIYPSSYSSIYISICLIIYLSIVYVLSIYLSIFYLIYIYCHFLKHMKHFLLKSCARRRASI